MRIRTYLFILGLVILAPMVAFAVMAVLALDWQQRVGVQRGAVETARALTNAVDRELSGVMTTLETLGTARSLGRDDLAAFHEDARRLLATRTEWNTIILIAPTGQLVVDAFFPFGTVLPRLVERESFETILRTGLPTVGALRRGPLTGRFASAVRVPVMRDGRIAYVLTGVVEVTAIQQILGRQQIPPDWVSTVFDQDGTVVARTRNAEAFVGQRVSPEFAQVLARSREGWEVTHTLEGAPVYTAYSRSVATGWGVGLGIPREVIDAPLQRSLWTIAGAGVVLMAGGTGLALLLGRRVARGLSAVAAAGTAIGRRRPVRLPPSGVREIDLAAASLATAATMRDDAEQALRENEARLATMVRSIGDGVIATDVHGRITFLNPTAATLTGWPETEAVGREVTDVFRIVNEHTGEPAENLVARVLAEGAVIGLTNDTMLITRDGRRIPIEDSAAPIRVLEEVTSGVVLVFHDASARRAALAEFRLLANTAPVLVWMAGPDGARTFFNQPWLDFTGRPLADELGQGWSAGVHPQDRPRCLAAARTALQDQRPFDVEYRLRRHDGVYRWVLDRGVPRVEPDGQLAGYIGSCLDITERRQGEEVQRYLAAIVDGSDDAIVSKTLDGIITSWNRGGPDVRLHRRRGHRAAHSPDRAPGAHRRGAGGAGPTAARGGRRPLRDGASPQGRDPPRRLVDHLTHPGPRGPHPGGLQDRPGHHPGQAPGAGPHRGAPAGAVRPAGSRGPGPDQPGADPVAGRPHGGRADRRRHVRGPGGRGGGPVRPRPRERGPGGHGPGRSLRPPGWGTSTAWRPGPAWWAWPSSPASRHQRGPPPGSPPILPSRRARPDQAERSPGGLGHPPPGG